MPDGVGMWIRLRHHQNMRHRVRFVSISPPFSQCTLPPSRTEAIKKELKRERESEGWRRVLFCLLDVTERKRDQGVCFIMPFPHCFPHEIHTLERSIIREESYRVKVWCTEMAITRVPMFFGENVRQCNVLFKDRMRCCESFRSLPCRMRRKQVEEISFIE